MEKVIDIIYNVRYYFKRLFKRRRSEGPHTPITWQVCDINNKPIPSSDTQKHCDENDDQRTENKVNT